MNILTERLSINEINLDDLYIIHKIHSYPEVDEFNTLGIPKNIEITKNVIQPAIDNQGEEKRTRFCWKIFLKSSDEIIGLCGMSLTADRFNIGEFYYKLIPEFWGKGYATETAKALITFGFEEMGLHRIEAGVATENKRSIRVLEKAGMINEGVRRKILPIRGEWKDNYHFAIVEDDITKD
jgi:[ribosomal protein S5]-alanine N-acetyltransferase